MVIVTCSATSCRFFDHKMHECRFGRITIDNEGKCKDYEYRPVGE